MMRFYLALRMIDAGMILLGTPLDGLARWLLSHAYAVGRIEP